MQVLAKWSVSAMFLDVVLKFGDQAQIFEESSGFRQAVQQPDGSFGMSCLYPSDRFLALSHRGKIRLL